MLLKKLYRNPVRAIITTFCVCILISFIGAAISAAQPGGDKTGLTFFAEVVGATWYILCATAIITLFFYREWMKKYWYKPAIFIAACVGIISADIIDRNKKDVGYSVEAIWVNNKRYEKTTRYYYANGKPKRIAFMLGDKKDSLWTDHNLDGSIARQVLYKNDTLVRVIK